MNGRQIGFLSKVVLCWGWREHVKPDKFWTAKCVMQDNGRMKMSQKLKYLGLCYSVSLQWANFKYFDLEIACILCYFIELEVFYTSQNLLAISDKSGQYASYSLYLRTNGGRECV